MTKKKRKEIYELIEKYTSSKSKNMVTLHEKILAIYQTAWKEAQIKDNYIQILSATIVRTPGTDKVYLATELPQTVWPFEGKAHLTLDIAHGNALKYLREHFPNLSVKIVTSE